MRNKRDFPIYSQRKTFANQLLCTKQNKYNKLKENLGTIVYIHVAARIDEILRGFYPRVLSIKAVSAQWRYSAMFAN